MVVADLLVDVLAAGDRATVRELVSAVRQRGGRGVSRTAVERSLRDDRRFVAVGDPGKATWALADTDLDRETDTDVDAGADADAAADADADADAGPDHEAGPEGDGVVSTRDRLRTRASMAALDPRPWQAEALAAWSTTCRGVVEAVTGTGKTRLAMLAIRSVVDAGGRALVLVPTLELQQQWGRELRELLPDINVGRLGGGGDDDLFDRQVIVATPHSAASVPIDVPVGAPGLLVADEAHRYGAPTWAAALSDAFGLRLALTATYERGDEGVQDVLEPYFGPIVCSYGYDRAVRDGTVAPFRIALAEVPLTDREREAHDAADVRARQLHRELVGGLGMPKDPRRLFAAVAAVVAEAGPGAGGDGPQVRACREYLIRVRERRDAAATAEGKLDVCRSAAPALATRRSLVFTDTVEQADDAVSVLRSAGVHAETVHGGLGDDTRRIRLAQFRRGRIAALVAPRVLDEGVDVPDADVAIVLAAFRSRRHLVQRLGRVLRLKDDGREARLVLTYAAGTAEDPARGGHAGFLDQVRDVARSIDPIEVTGARHAVGDWLDR